MLTVRAGAAARRGPAPPGWAGRGVLFAVAAAVLTMGGHGLAGGRLHPHALVVVFVAALVVHRVAFARRRQGRASFVATMLTFQGVSHAALSTHMAGGGHAPAHGRVVREALLAAAAQPGPAMSAEMLAMVAGHVLAAVACGVALHANEAWQWTCCQLSARWAAGLLVLVGCLLVPPRDRSAARWPRVSAPPPAAPQMGWALTARRGPPVGASAR